ncbi:DNA glycosylase [Blastocladiella britannica]|nr:DNA glycosylase [Blastocladiella britannica]
MWSPWTRLAPGTELALTRTLTCGQSFTWTRLPTTGAWCNVLLAPPDRTPHAVVLRQDPSSDDDVQFRTLLLADTNESRAIELRAAHAHLTDYFRLSDSVVDLYADWAQRDPSHFATTAPRVLGLRLMRQDPTETLFGFICSSNNNIPRITAMVRALAVQYGTRVCDGGLMDADEDGEGGEVIPPLFAFPSSADLVAHRDELDAALRALGFGYRAKFIRDSADAVEAAGGNRWLLGLRDLSYAAVLPSLLDLGGVGRKVADCVMLMSLDKHQAIPVDTHVWQIATRDYGFVPSRATKSLTPTTYQEVTDLFVTKFGDRAGWAHSVLFTADLDRAATRVARGLKKKGARSASLSSESDDDLDVVADIVVEENDEAPRRRKSPRLSLRPSRN